MSTRKRTLRGTILAALGLVSIQVYTTPKENN